LDSTSSVALHSVRIDSVEVDDIISYHDVVTAERAALQKGMNFGVGKKYSMFLMSLHRRTERCLRTNREHFIE
jgi:hypothetical protein